VTAVLELSRISKRFGEFAALNGAEFELRQGEVHALLGENGAGKSSLMNIAAGLYTADAGSVLFNGEEVYLSGPRDARRRGIGMVQQHFRLVKTCSVAENVLLANPTRRYGAGLNEIRAQIRQRSGELGFKIDPLAPIHALSLAEQQRVEILKVLIGGARVIILDEPTAVLSENEADRLLYTLRALALGGAAVVLVTHKLREVAATDRVTVMRGGQTIGTFASEDVTPKALATMIVGTEIAPAARLPRQAGERRLNIVGLKCGRDDGHVTVNDATFFVRAGEIYGIAGISGNGQSELVEALMGVRRPLSGNIEIAGIGELSTIPAHRRRNGPLSVIPADRNKYALARGVSIRDNYIIAHVHAGRYGSAAWMRFKKMNRDTRAALDEFEVQGIRSLRQGAALLSGGNAQKLVLARELQRRPSVIVAHNPNRGLDVRACAAVYRRLLSARDGGAAIVLISEDMDEILLLSDRIGVLAGGRIVEEFDSPADRQDIGRAMVSHA
jgi:general nucleoside transport system ATP-binding protein